jgi:hypothetical protein
MGLKKALRKLGKTVFPGTGRHAAKRAEKQANQYAAEAEKQRLDNQRKTERDRKRAQKLAIRGLRSRRSASYFQSSAPAEGSQTIG